MEPCIFGLDFVITHKLTVDGKNQRISSHHNNNRHTISFMSHLQNISITKETDNVGDDLTPEQIQQLKNLLERHKDIFANSTADLTGTSIIKHIIKTKEGPIHLPPYRTPVTLKPLVKEQLKELLENQIIRPSNSPYGAPIIMVKKKEEGKYRMVCDFRKVNADTVKDNSVSVMRLPHFRD